MAERLYCVDITVWSFTFYNMNIIWGFILEQVAGDGGLRSAQLFFEDIFGLS